MDFILDNIYVVVLIAAAVAQWINTQREAKKAEREERENPVDVEEIFGPDFDFGEQHEERPRQVVPPPLRRAEAAVPPPLFKAAEPEKAPVVRQRQSEVAVPVVTSAAETELARQAELMERVRAFKESKPAKQAGNARETRAFMKRRASGEAELVRVDAGIRGRLRNRAEVRKAFIMKEILDKPIALR